MRCVSRPEGGGTSVADGVHYPRQTGSSRVGAAKAAGILPAMRVRAFGLRLLAAGLTTLWTIAAGLVLIGYRPGGPIDGLVGIAALLPIPISLIGVFFPPALRGDRAFAAMAWLGLGAILLLIPSIGAVLTQLLARGPQTLLPSPEAAYPWLLALLATSLFGGVGLARRVRTDGSTKQRRLVLGVLIALVATTASASLFAAAAIGNELALRDTPAIVSRFGPSSGGTEPAACTAAISAGATAVLSLTVRGDVDGRPIGTIDLHGTRNGNDVEWLADVATEVAGGSFGLVRVGPTTWTQPPRGQWTSAPVDGSASPADSALAAFVARPTIDQDLVVSALASSSRKAAEERGLEFLEGARARHCRVAIDGRAFQAALPAVLWMSSRQDLHRWRGSLDYWIFLDGQIGQVSATINGEARSLGRDGLQAHLSATLTATDRGRPLEIRAPS